MFQNKNIVSSARLGGQISTRSCSRATNYHTAHSKASEILVILTVNSTVLVAVPRSCLNNQVCLSYRCLNYRSATAFTERCCSHGQCLEACSVSTVRDICQVKVCPGRRDQSERLRDTDKGNKSSMYGKHNSLCKDRAN